MFEQLTPRMSRVVKISQRIARDYGQDYVGTEHMLLAVLEEGTGLACRILLEHEVDLSKTKHVVDQLIQKSLEDTWVFGRLPGTPHFRNVMALAIEEARQLESKVVCTEHLLIALAREEGSVAHNALRELGIRAADVRAAIIRNFDAEVEEPDKSAPSSGE